MVQKVVWQDCGIKGRIEEDLRQRKHKHIYFLGWPSQWGGRYREDEMEGINSRATGGTENDHIETKWKTKQNDSMTMKCQIINRAIYWLLGFLFFYWGRFLPRALMLLHLERKPQGTKRPVGETSRTYCCFWWHLGCSLSPLAFAVMVERIKSGDSKTSSESSSWQAERSWGTVPQWVLYAY